ncbi:MAG: hypothetical protein JSS98_09445 [Bacteroidetes bacterium]|nr:hypothetical protein [Bacteroidota bacterium]
MQTKYLLFIAFVLVLGSCSTAYRTGQTPDDVYYSPTPANDDYVTQYNQDDRNSYDYRNSEEYEIRRGIRNPVYRNSISIGLGFGGYSPYYSMGFSPYFGSPYGYNYFGYNNFYNPYSYSYLNGFNYNGFYNPYPYYNGNYGYGHSGYYGNYYGNYLPYYPGIGTVNTNRGVRRMNGATGSYGAANRGTNGYTPAPARTFPTQRPSSGVGNVLRRVFNSGSNTSERNSNSRPANTRTFNTNRSTESNPTRDFNSSSNSGSRSSGNSNSGGSAPARVFRK